MSSSLNIFAKSTKKIPLNDKILKGIPSSPGYIYGKVFVLKPETITLPNSRIKTELVSSELERFDAAIKEFIQEIITAIKKIEDDSNKIKAILETNLLMLSDEIIIDAIKSQISNQYSTETAVINEFDAQIRILKSSKDILLGERAFELEQMKSRLLSILHNKCILYSEAKDSILVAQSVTPFDVIHFYEAGVLGIITEVGGIASHSSILTRSYEIVEVIGVQNATKLIGDDTKLIVDGYTGRIILNPRKTSISIYIQNKKREEEHKKQLGELVKLPSITTDGKKIKLMANIDVPKDVESAVRFGAEGIGLVRSEQLIILKNSFPDEQEQLEWYQSIAERAYPNSVTIRAFDVGSDKYSEGLLKHENNPALGFRGIRYLLNRTDIFRSQVRAILKASKHKNLKFMLPMITYYSEISQSIEFINKCKDELRQENIAFDESIPVGIMIETPAAALNADKISKNVDFFSIGTNDLTQYTLAVDRTNELVAPLYDSFHVSVLKLIKITADAAVKRKIPVSICGEIAGHSAAVELLIGLGISELSVSPQILLEVKQMIRNISYKNSKNLAKSVLKDPNCENVRQWLASKETVLIEN